MRKNENVFIVGAGIAGIVAAIIEEDKGNNVVLLDSSDRPGGLLKSDYIDEHYFDYGTHIIPDTGIGGLDEKLYGDLTPEDYSIKKVIPAGNYFNGAFNENSCYVDTSVLPESTYNQGCVDLLGAKHKSPSNLEEWYTNRYGETFSQEIFCPVIKKYIGVKASLLAPSVGYFFDMSRLLAFDQSTTETLGEIKEYYQVLGHHVRKEGVTKYYPLTGGVGAFVNHLVDKLHESRVLLGCQVKSISQNNGVVDEVATTDGSFTVDRLIWTIPTALLAFHLPLGVKVEKPVFRGTFLFDYIFDAPLLSNVTFINVYDLNMYSGRITLYQNFTGETNHKGACTVEILTDEVITPDDILSELIAIGLVDKKSNCLLKRKRDVFNGFPVLDLEYVEQSNKQSKHYREYFKNIDFLGKASEGSFFMRDVLREVYEKLMMSEI